MLRKLGFKLKWPFGKGIDERILKLKKQKTKALKAGLGIGTVVGIGGTAMYHKGNKKSDTGYYAGV